MVCESFKNEWKMIKEIKKKIHKKETELKMGTASYKTCYAKGRNNIGRNNKKWLWEHRDKYRALV
jgi:hypothetical protein